MKTGAEILEMLPEDIAEKVKTNIENEEKENFQDFLMLF